MTDTAPHTPEAADATLFDDTLSHALTLPVAVEPSDSIGRQTQAIALLSALAQVEDLRKDETSEDSGDLLLLAQRMDAKLDLVLSLLSRLARRADGLHERSLQWSCRGLRIDMAPGDALAPGSHVVVRLQPSDWLPDHLELPARVLATDAAAAAPRVWVTFEGLQRDLVETLDRHLFRLHRRQVAEQRRADPRP
ncbi:MULTISPECIES: PilZ domain-containing protein [Luteimonas]|uniref:PilZ domain-containing protein n=1 Tax=Luteimonas TaxID=83614 RepID=UPI000C7C59C8|nr:MULTISPECIES: PilZ domain-containing protein [Luteimonas]